MLAVPFENELHLDNGLPVIWCFQIVFIPCASVILIVYLVSCVLFVPFYLTNGV